MRLLNLDIETIPGAALFFDRRKPVYIGPEAVLSPSRVGCMAYQWVDLSSRQGLTFGPIKFTAEWKPGGAPKFAANVHALLEQADAVVSYNGVKFDLPKLNGLTTKHGFSSLPDPVHVDLFRCARKLGLDSASLNNVLQEFLGLSKLDNDGMALWKAVYMGDKEARAKMEAYNRVDVERTGQLLAFFWSRGFNLGIPHVGLFEGVGSKETPSCPGCGLTAFMTRQGVRLARKGVYQRYRCTDCGRWSSAGRAIDRRDVG